MRLHFELSFKSSLQICLSWFSAINIAKYMQCTSPSYRIQILIRAHLYYRFQLTLADLVQLQRACISRVGAEYHHLGATRYPTHVEERVVHAFFNVCDNLRLFQRLHVMP